ncbi:preprotein translocase subunit SecE [Thermithiobacillus plumbiphilus]|uniref:Protein translocase subunit SecE n=1 Tax=Thermithiobacillus plumbiphilus TaxID=1729899 RepID=A0ABU9DCS1_9PROT
MSERQKMILVGALATLGVLAYFLIPSTQPLAQVAAVLVGVFAAAGVFLTSEKGRGSIVFVREAVAEAGKVVWPSRKEVVQTTGVIMLMVSVIAIFLWMVDFGLLWLVQLIMRQES